MANQFLGLSLFIMLLCFFLILNSISTFEITKAGSVIDSLSVAFSSKPLTQDALAPNVTPDPMQAFREGDNLDKIQALFQSQITGFEAHKNRLGTMMRISLSQYDFEKLIMGPQGLPDDNYVDSDFLNILVSLLDTQNETSYRLDIIMRMQMDPVRFAKASPAEFQNNLRRTAIYAERLEAIGLPKKLLTVGLGQGKPDTIDLYFRLYQPLDIAKALQESGAQ